MYALSDESLLLCDNGELHYHIQSKKCTLTFFGGGGGGGDIISSTVEIKFGPFLRGNIINLQRNLTSMKS